MTAEIKFDLNVLIREHIEDSDEADPHVIAAEIVTAVADADLRSALAQCIGAKVRLSAIKRRQDRDVGAPQSARWGAVRDQQKTGALAIYRWRVHLDGDWKFFGDCTREDVKTVVADYKRRAVDMADQAQRFKAVAAVMAELDVVTVESVPVERLVEIFNA